jgi:hypothetical protein
MTTKEFKSLEEKIKGMKTGHSSYSCRSDRGGFCVCGADEDRWNLAIDEVLSLLSTIKTKE